MDTRRLGLATTLAICLMAGGRAEAGGASDRLKQFFAAANQAIEDPSTDDRPLEEFVAIQRLVNEIGDWEAASARALGVQWKARRPEEQEEFARLFANLLQRTFVSVMASRARVEGGASVTWISERAEGDETVVATTVLSKNGTEFPVVYRMGRIGEQWRVRDVTIEGVSLVDNYRAQVVAVLRRSSYPNLLGTLRSHVAGPGVPAPTAPGIPLASGAATPAVPPPPFAALSEPVGDPGMPGLDAVPPVLVRLRPLRPSAVATEERAAPADAAPAPPSAPAPPPNPEPTGVATAPPPPGSSPEPPSAATSEPAPALPAVAPPSPPGTVATTGPSASGASAALTSGMTSGSPATGGPVVSLVIAPAGPAAPPTPSSPTVAPPAAPSADPAPREPGVPLAPPRTMVPVPVTPPVAAGTDTSIEFVSGPEPAAQRPAPPVRERAVVAALPLSEPPTAAAPAPSRPTPMSVQPAEPRSGVVPAPPQIAAVPPQPTLSAAVRPRTYWVQVGWYKTPDDAARVAAQLNAWGPTSVVGPVTRAQGPYGELPSRVVMGPFATRDLAQSAVQRLGTMGIMGSITERRE